MAARIASRPVPVNAVGPAVCGRSSGRSTRAATDAPRLPTGLPTASSAPEPRRPVAAPATPPARAGAGGSCYSVDVRPGGRA